MRAVVVVVFLIVVAGIASVEPKCESPAFFPVMYDSKYLCAILYQERGHPDALFGCNGSPLYHLEENYFSADQGYYYPYGSIIVKAGCSFYGYKEFNYQGEKLVFRGPALLSESPGLVHGDDPQSPDGFRSIMCDCDMAYITCTPTDNFEVVLYCDASQAAVDIMCRYSKTIGTSFSSTISDSMHIDSTIEASMTASFFGLFEATLSTSVSTGYNWATTSEEAKSEQVTVEVEATAPSGMILVIEQAVGHCDGSNVKTEMYKISHFDGNGNLVESKMVHASDL